MSRTLIISKDANGKFSVADENGCLPPAGWTDDRLWFVELINGKRVYWFRRGHEHILQTDAGIHASVVSNARCDGQD
jgi:hypothetical protein